MTATLARLTMFTRFTSETVFLTSLLSLSAKYGIDRIIFHIGQHPVLQVLVELATVNSALVAHLLADYLQCAVKGNSSQYGGY